MLSVRMKHCIKGNSNNLEVPLSVQNIYKFINHISFKICELSTSYKKKQSFRWEKIKEREHRRREDYVQVKKFMKIQGLKSETDTTGYYLIWMSENWERLRTSKK
jgi:hypothetical protein